MDILRTVGEQAVNILVLILNVYSWTIFIRVIMSWFVPKDNSIFMFLAFITDPILEPIRRKMEPLMRRSSIPIDVSPIIAYFIIMIIAEILGSLF